MVIRIRTSKKDSQHIAKRKRTKVQTTIYKTFHLKLKIDYLKVFVSKYTNGPKQDTIFITGISSYCPRNLIVHPIVRNSRHIFTYEKWYVKYNVNCKYEQTCYFRPLFNVNGLYSLNTNRRIPRHLVIMVLLHYR